MIKLTCTFSIDNHGRYGSIICITTLLIHARVQYFTTVLYCLHSRDSAVVHTVHFYRTLSCTISIDYHLRYCSLICIMSLIIQIRVQYLTDHIIKLNTVEMRSWRSWYSKRNWLNLTVTLHITSQNQERIGCAVSSCLKQKNICCPNFQNTYTFGGQLQPTNTVAQWSFQAIQGNRANGVVKACPIFRLVLQNFSIPGCFPYVLFYRYLFSLLSSGWFVIAVCGSVSVRELVKYLGLL